MANEEKLLHLVNVIGAAQERGEWDQNVWGERSACGTTMCAAGWQCIIEGKELKYVTEDSGARCAFTTTDGKSIPDFARVSLGLTKQEASLLFLDTDNNYDEFVANVKSIIAGEVE